MIMTCNFKKKNSTHPLPNLFSDFFFYFGYCNCCEYCLNSFFIFFVLSPHFSIPFIWKSSVHSDKKRKAEFLFIEKKKWWVGNRSTEMVRNAMENILAQQPITKRDPPWFHLKNTLKRQYSSQVIFQFCFSFVCLPKHLNIAAYHKYWLCHKFWIY